MNKARLHIGVSLLELLCFAILFAVHFLGILQIERFHATAFLLLPFFITFCMFESELPAAFSGLALGMFLDAFSAESSIFNTLFFFFLRLVRSL